MEILELEKEIENKYKLEENKENLVGTLLQNLKDDYTDFLVMILKPKYKTDYYNLEMFGIKGIDYILNAVQDFEIKQVELNLDDDVIKVIKQNLNSKKYVLVLYADTPLIKKQTIINILDYFLIKKLCALSFNRGYCFDTNYLKNVDKIYNPQTQEFEEEDFIKVDSSKSFSSCLEILKNRIISYHQQNGVIFENTNSCYIDAKVNIEKGVIIKNNVTILGKSIVRENSILYNCSLNRVILEKNTIIENSIIENSVVGMGAKIKDYSIIKNASVKENSVLTNEKIL